MSPTLPFIKTFCIFIYPKTLFIIRIYTLIFCFLSFTASGQWSGVSLINFDPGDVLYPIAITIDTTHCSHNIWQIGAPNKTTFTSAYSVPNTIVTDTLNPYPPNDTSVFILKIPANEGFGFTFLNFYYQLDIDSNAQAKVEMSLDTALHWINLADSLPMYYHWPSGQPDLHHSTTGWTNFFLAHYLPTTYTYPDTILFRFTFISDSVVTGKDGWMIDEITLDYIWEGLPKLQNDNLISIYPNPSKGNVYIHAAKQYAESKISVYNTLGQEVYHTEKPPQNGFLSLPLPDGIYTLKYFAGDEYCVKRIVIAL